jgi:HAD superfamily hydrolase (TIGR01549 family)
MEYPIRDRTSIVSLVVFDIDGVLIDTAGMVTAGQMSVAQRLGLFGRDQEELQEAWRDLAVTIGGEVTPAFLECLLEECRLRGLQVQQDAPVFDAFLEAYWKNVTSMARAGHLMQWLYDRDIRVGIVSNGSRSTQLRKLQLAGMLDWFDSALIEIRESDSRYAKPDPSVLRTLINKVGTSPLSTAYVGDRVGDVLTAKLCGCISVLLADEVDHPNVNENLRVVREVAGSHLLIAKPDLVVPSLHLLQGLLIPQK